MTNAVQSGRAAADFSCRRTDDRNSQSSSRTSKSLDGSRSPEKKKKKRKKFVKRSAAKLSAPAWLSKFTRNHRISRTVGESRRRCSDRCARHDRHRREIPLVASACFRETETRRENSSHSRPRKYYAAVDLSPRALRSPDITRGLVCQRGPARAYTRGSASPSRAVFAFHTATYCCREFRNAANRSSILERRLVEFLSLSLSLSLSVEKVAEKSFENFRKRLARNRRENRLSQKQDAFTF